MTSQGCKLLTAGPTGLACLGLLLVCTAGCTESRGRCGDGQYFAAGDVERCAYAGGLVIETGFSCPAFAPHRLDFEGGTVCSSEEELPRDLPSEVCFHVSDPECGARPTAPDAGQDTSSSATGAACDMLDVLFVIDSSSTMGAEQDQLASWLPTLLDMLGSGGGEGGVPTFAAPTDMHFGVISADMGSGSFLIGQCDFQGDDGVLRTNGDPSQVGCAPPYPSFLRFDSSTSDPTQTADDLACLARLGTNGCEVEQHLEAALKALAPDEAGLLFTDGTAGHGDGANNGFLRPDAQLAIIILTDEDDCSLRDISLFDPDVSNATYPGELSLRCHTYPEALQPILRYVDGLVALKARPGQVFVGIIACIPVDLVDGGTGFEAILADPRMEERVDPDLGTELAASCTFDDGGTQASAYPPRRLVTTARDLSDRSAHTTLASLCQADISPALSLIGTGLAEALSAEECTP